MDGTEILESPTGSHLLGGIKGMATSIANIPATNYTAQHSVVRTTKKAHI
jgi:hypothetical protein